MPTESTTTFTRQPVTPDPLVVTYFIGGTATNGVDYPQIGADPDPLEPKFITIPGNTASASILIEPIADGLDEGDESIVFYVGNPLCEGTIQDSLEFIIQDSLDLAVNPPLSFVCLGDSITFDVESSATSFTWSPADFLNDPNIQSPTSTPTGDITYTVTAGAAGCTSQTTVELQVTDVQLSADVTSILCNGEDNGAIDLTVSGGQSPIEYAWVGPNGFTSDSEDLSDLEPGTYAVLVTDRDGCTANLSVEIEEVDAIELELSSPEFNGGDNISCFAAEDGQATVNVNGGTPPYVFTWDDPDTQTGQTADDLAAGTYTVLVTDANGCEAEGTITLTSPDAITGQLVERTNVPCTGEATGSATIEAVGGNGPFSYTWNTTPPQFGPTVENVPAGFYTATITDVNGCTGNIEIEITEPDTPLSGSVDVDPPLCNGDASGVAMANISGGTPPYIYVWSIDPAFDQPSISNLPAGSYNLLVEDANGCTLSIPFNVSEPSELEIQIVSQQDVSCNGNADGQITVAGSGGTSPYSYEWNTDPVTTGTSLSDLEPGDYEVTVTDANGCEESLSVTITQPEPLSLSETISNPLCSDSNDGEITVEAEGGTAPYSYQWDTESPETGSTISGLGAGEYEITVTDQNNCTIQATYEIVAPTEIIISVEDIENVLCNGGETGSVEVSATGGTPDYSFSWNDPANQTGPEATELAAGVYTVTVTDENGCEETLDVTITEPQNPLDGSITDLIDVDCFGESTGQATAQGTGGSGSYSYQWDDPNGQETSTATNLAAGEYTVTITDNNGCTVPVVLNVTIGGPSDPLEIELTPSEFDGGFNVACADDSTATIDLEISGGTAPYSVLWDLPGLDTSTDEDLSDLAPGVYAVTVTDANGCEEMASVELTAPTPISISASTTPSLCFGSPTGSIELEIFGGVPGYTVSWNGPDGFTSSDLILDNIEGGIYNLEIEDSNGCIYTDAVTVNQPEDIVINIDSISDYNGFNLSCFNSTDGAIFTSVTGGLEPYSFQWNTAGNTNFSNQPDVQNLGPGSYEIVVIDDNGCVQSEIITLTAPDTVGVDFNVSEYDNGFNISCFGAADGSIEGIPIGGAPEFTYLWIGPGGFGPVSGNPIENLEAGEYSVLVSDGNNCNAFGTVTLTEPEFFAISLVAEEINGSNISCNGNSDGSINLIVNGGAPPFAYSWTGPDGFTNTSEDLSDLPAGEYCVDVTDANDCTESACITLSEPEVLTASPDALVYANGANLSCDDSEDGEITSNISGGTPPYSVSWTGPGNFTSTELNPTGLAAGEYCADITDANGCQFNTCITLEAPEPLEVELDVNTPSGCAGENSGALEVTVTGGLPAYAFSWTGPDGFSASTEDISNLAPGTYCLTAEDAEGCTTERCFEVAEPAPIEVTLNAVEYEGGVEIDCNGNDNGSISSTVNGSFPPYSYSWTGPNGFTSDQSAIDNLEPGNYCLEVTDSNNCTTESCIEITEPDPLSAVPDLTIPDCGDGTPATIDLNVSGGTPPYAFNWSNGETTEVITVEEGIYSVVITDANGCETTEDLAIILPTPIVVIPQSPETNGFNIACNGESTGTISTLIFGGDGDLTAEWTGPNGFTSTSGNLSNLEAGTYCITVTDEQNCTGEACITLTEPQPIAIDLSANETACSDSEDGSISATVSGGVPTYSISWTGPDGFTATGTELDGLAPGTYCAEVTDFNECTNSECVDINSPDPLSATLSSPEFDGFNIACFGDNSGSINTTVTGGTDPYSFSWTGDDGYASTEENPTALFAGEYCAVITDANGCSTETCITLTEAPGIDVSISVFEFPNGFNVSCGDACDGSLEATLTGGAEPIEINWTGPDGFSSDQLVLTDLCAGTYSLNTTDANGCEQSTSITLSAPEPIVIDLDSPVFGGGNEISCFGENTGTINTQVSGGIGDYTLSWTGPDGFTSANDTITNLIAGTYTLNVEDEDGCTASAQIELSEPDVPLTATASPFEFPSGDNISCLGANDGSITANPNGGTPPYIYNWNGPNGFNSDLETVEGLEPGEYTLVVEDANSCVFTVVVTLTEPETELAAGLGVLSEILCAGEETGELVAIPSDGSPDYTVLWAGPNNYTSTEFQIGNLAPGTYTFVVEDANGCTASGAYTLIAPSPITISAEVIDAECETPTGTIDITVSGGTSPYTYSWSNGTDGQDIVSETAGEYDVLVTDENGCTAADTFEIETVNALVVEATVSNLICNGDSTGMIDVFVTEGTEPVSFEWTGPDGYENTGSLIADLAAGAYTLNASDAAGCSITETFEVTQPDPLQIEELNSPNYPNGFNLSGFQADDGRILSPVVSGGTTPYFYEWGSDNGYESSSGDNQLNLMAGNYFLVVKDDNMCTDTAFIELTQPIPIELPNGISPNGDGFNDALLVRGLEDFPNNRLLVFNRWGNQIYEESNYRNTSPWYGVNESGKEVPEGTYFVVVELEGRDNLRGYLEIRR
ncbi:MAG: gliding motility-associated C-terminal domain-containing protein [Flavobacteriales bacterium]|nr:gliding motility-associated C-terminal domain-containing protein [Flavobacteriales bacterium]